MAENSLVSPPGASADEEPSAYIPDSKTLEGQGPIYKELTASGAQPENSADAF
jgi:hypothetical protein